ncbi:Coatomer subunit beta'-1 [Hondaea fermentalgiana]|uniref:Coatomer subunit beta'-1 n=1 Tax=Hondaea fermentalgiana TaxID=2315210 RepID=A0A2R5GRX1_9STRA|nr:Coatomer subunit beta'-1 [Hondaea fermentalgiana]|eukprot:GBG33345.1 Coatomer subunit beta'-1 [Hondaea fermentalgiana]
MLAEIRLEDGTTFDVILDQYNAEGELLSWIARSIEKSDVFLPLITVQYMTKVNSDDRSDNCWRELLHAAHQMPNRIVPAIMETAVPDRRFWTGRLSVVLGEEVHINLFSDEIVREKAFTLATMLRNKATGEVRTRKGGAVFPLDYGFDPYLMVRNKAANYVKNTRDWIIERIADWYVQEREAWMRNRIFVLFAPAGYGKSVIMAWLCYLGGLLVAPDVETGVRRPSAFMTSTRSLIGSETQSRPSKSGASSTRRSSSKGRNLRASLGAAMRRASSRGMPGLRSIRDGDSESEDESEYYAERRVILVGGVHFFKHDDDQASSVRTCLYSLANQLADVIPGMRENLSTLDAQELDRDVLDLNALFMTLIANPCSQIMPMPTERIVLIIDGLDEAKKDQRTLFLQLLQTRWLENTPRWLGLIISSRPASIIPYRLQRFHPYEVSTSDAENEQDMKLYMKVELKPYMHNPNELDEAAEIMAERSEGLFLYASFLREVLSQLELGSVSLDQIREETNRFPDGLDGMYTENFSRFLDSALDGNRKLYTVLLGSMAVSRSPIPLELLSTLLSTLPQEEGEDEADEDRVTDEDRVDELLDRARQLLYVGDDEIGFVHKSMVDFLTSRERASELYVRPLDGHLNLARVCLSVDHPFGDQNVLYHLCMSKQFKEVPPLLLDFSWLMRALGKHAVPFYDLVLDAERFYLPRRGALPNGEGRGRGRGGDGSTMRFQSDLVIRAIEKGGEALIQDPRELASQLLGRITDDQHPIVASIRDNWAPHNKAWLRPVRPVLIRANAALRKTLRDHTAPVRAVSNALDIIVSGSDDHTIRTWSADTGQEQLLMEGHDAPVQSVYILDRLIASGDNDGTVCLWNAETGQLRHRLFGHAGPVNCVIILQRPEMLRRRSRPNAEQPMRTLVASGGADGGIRVWDAISGNVLRNLEGHTSAVNDFACAPLEPFGDYPVLVSCSDDGNAIIWSPFEGQELATLAVAAKETPAWLAVAIDLATPDSTVALGSLAGDIVIFDASTRDEVFSFRDAHRGAAVRCLALQGDTLVSGGDDKYVHIWDIGEQTHIRLMRGHTNVVRALTLKGDVVISSSDDTTLKVWNFKDSTIFTRDAQRHRDEVTKIKISGTTIVSASADATLRTWDAETGAQLEVLQGHEDCVNAIAFRDNIIISGSDDDTVRMWNTENARIRVVFNGHTDSILTVSLDLDMMRAYSGSADNTIRAWSLKPPYEHLFTLTGHTAPVNSISHHGGALASGSDDSTIRLWNVRARRVIQVLSSHAGPVTSVTLRENVVASASLDQTLRIWNRAENSFVETSCIPVTDPEHPRTTIRKVFVLDAGVVVASTEHGKVYSFSLNTGMPIGQRARIWRHMASPIPQFDGVHMSLASRRCIGYTSDTNITTVAADANIAVAGDESGRVHVLQIVDGARV